MYRTLIVAILLAMISNIAIGQMDMAYRNKNWKPKQGKYLFTQMMVYKYKNDIVDADDEFRRSGEMVVYFDEVTGTMLLTSEAYGITGEMIDFVIIEPSSKYTFGSTDEFGKKSKLIFYSEVVSDAKINQQSILKNFMNYLKPTGKKKNFGKSDYKLTTIEGKEYIMKYEKTNETSMLYIAKGKLNMNALYAFNRLNTETKLPIEFDFINVLPEKYIVLSSSYQYQGKESSFELINISPTEYFIDLNEYKSTKKKP